MYSNHNLINNKVFLVLGSTNMRKSINGLMIEVSNHEGLDVFSGNFFVFCNATKKIIKILYWEQNGFCLWQKRLEKHHFKWPNNRSEVYAIDPKQLRWLLDGLDIKQLTSHRELLYKNVR